MGGIDSKGPHVVYIHAGGNHAYLPFIAMGSGSLNCIAVLESEYRDGMNVYNFLKFDNDILRLTKQNSF